MSKLIRDAAFHFLLVAFVATDFVAAANADPQPAEILTGIYKEAVKGATADLARDQPAPQISLKIITCAVGEIGQQEAVGGRGWRH
jgi:hypothetical protein